MTLQNIRGTDWGEGVVRSGHKFTLIDQFGDSIENVMLLDDVIGFVHRPREHKLPTNPHAFQLEGAGEVEMIFVAGD